MEDVQQQLRGETQTHADAAAHAQTETRMTHMVQMQSQTTPQSHTSTGVTLRKVHKRTLPPVPVWSETDEDKGKVQTMKPPQPDKVRTTKPYKPRSPPMMAMLAKSHVRPVNAPKKHWSWRQIIHHWWI